MGSEQGPNTESILGDPPLTANWHRWGKITRIAVVGAAIVSLGAPIVVPLAWEWLVREPTLADASVPIAIALIIIAVAALSPRSAHETSIHIPVPPWVYPSIYTAGILGSVLVAAFWRFVPSVAHLVGRGDLSIDTSYIFECTLFVMAAYWAMARMLYLWRDSRRSKAVASLSTKPAGGDDSESSIETDFAAIIRWVSDDREIAFPTDDRFRHDSIAQRISKRLVSNNTKKRPAIAVVGQLGAGKTSVRNLTQYHLMRSDARVAIVPISLWPFRTPNAATQAILDSIVAELARHIDTRAIASIPDEYVHVIDRAGPLNLLTPFLSRRKPPDELLVKLDEAAAAIKLRIVVWVEDLERFSAIESVAQQSIREGERQRLGPIRALLHLIERCDHLSVVLASTSLEVQVDLEKIAHFIEVIPSLDCRLIGPVLHNFRQGCIHSLGSKHYAGKKNLSNFNEVVDESQFSWHIAYRWKEWEAFVQICRTPRILKLTMRTCWEAWQVLGGEIDLDDLFHACLLKAAEPEAFAFLCQHIGEIREPTRDKGVSVFLDTHGAEISKGAKNVILKLFDSGSRDRPQGFAKSHWHVDYWERFLTMRVVSDFESDQSAIDAVKKCAGGNYKDCAARLANERQHGSIEQFSFLLSYESVLALFKYIVRARIVEDAGQWVDSVGHSDVPGIVPIWRMLRDHRDRHIETAQAVSLCVREALQSNFTVANSISHYFATNETQISNLLLPEEISAVQCDITSEISQYANRPAEHLIGALRNAPEYNLYQLVWNYDRIRRGELAGEPFSGWVAFARCLLDAADLEPALMLEQILPFFTITRNKRLVDGVDVSVDFGRARELFDWPRLRKQLQSFTGELDGLSSQETLRIVLQKLEDEPTGVEKHEA